MEEICRRWFIVYFKKNEMISNCKKGANYTEIRMQVVPVRIPTVCRKSRSEFFL